MHQTASRSYCLLCLSLLLVAWASPGSADTPIFVDSFRPTAPDHTPGSPVHGAKLERGHGRWEGTPGLYFDDGKVRGAGPSEYARTRFAPQDHQRSTRVYIDTLLDPGSGGWAGVGFTNGEDGPLPSEGQLWFKLSHNGKVEVRADGASNTLYHDSHSNPAFVPGMNRVRLEYNRRLNSARAWLNGVELPLDDVGKNGFIPEIQAVAFQLKDTGQGLKALSLEPGSAGIILGVGGAYLGDEFTTVGVLQQGRHVGDALSGVEAEVGDQVWVATPSVGFGQDYATNIGLGMAVAGLPYDPDDHPGYAVSSVEALVNPADSDWIGIGFSSNGTSAFTATGVGQVWARVFSTGRLQVLADGTSQVLFDEEVIKPDFYEGGLPFKISYNRTEYSIRVDIGEAELGIDSVTVDVDTTSFLPMIGFAGFQGEDYSEFTATDQFALDNFAVLISEEVPVLEVTEHPTSVVTYAGGSAEFSCSAAGGVEPHTYRWQRNPFIMTPPGLKSIPLWSDITAGSPGYSGMNTDTLVVEPVTSDHAAGYRCVVEDSNSVPSSAASVHASLIVREIISLDTFLIDAGRTVGEPLDGQTPEIGDGPWSASAEAVLGDDHLTNDVTGTAVYGELPITQLMTDTYKTLILDTTIVVGETSWLGVGFSDAGLAPFWNNGRLWVLVNANGAVTVFVEGTSFKLFDQTILTASDLENPVHVRLEYSFDLNQAKVFVNGDQLALDFNVDEIIINESLYVPPIETAGFHAYRPAGFTNPGMFIIDDLAISGDDETAPPTFEPTPASQSLRIGQPVTLECGAQGGVGDLNFYWTRYSGDETVIEPGGPFSFVTPSGNRLDLMITDYDQSLEGQYRCYVSDSRLGGMDPVYAPVTLSTTLPDLRVAFGGLAGDTIFVADAYSTIDERVDWLEAGVSYTLKFVIHGAGDIEPTNSFPISLYGVCHPPGASPDPPFSWLLPTPVPFWANGNEGHYSVPFEVPPDCLGGGSWGVMSIVVDANAVDDPLDPYGTYPASIFGALHYHPELNSWHGNRGELPSWIPVVAPQTNLDSAVGGSVLSADFSTSSHLPLLNRYPTEWIDARINTGSPGELEFYLDLWNPCLHYYDAIPDVTNPDSTDLYQPYMVWQTGNPVKGVMIRQRKSQFYGSGSQPNLFFAGQRPGTPNDPSVTLPYPPDIFSAENVATFSVGAHGATASANHLTVGSDRQYRVLVWGDETNDFVHDANYDGDGVATLETMSFPDGGAPTTGLASSWLYLGYAKDEYRPWSSGACPQESREVYYVDFIRAWSTTTGTPIGETVDFNAAALVHYDPTSGWEPMPAQVNIGDEYRVCLQVGVYPTDTVTPPDEVMIDFGTQCSGGDASYSNSYSAETVSAPGLPVGSSIYCPVDEYSQPVYWEFVDLSGLGCGAVHAINGCLSYSEDVNPNNDCRPGMVAALPDLCPVPVVDLP